VDALTAVPWTDQRFPPAMRQLDPVTRAKAIEIANALLREGRDEGFAIRVAIARARAWHQEQPQQSRSSLDRF
jgi:uncharacterized protein YdaT